VQCAKKRIGGIGAKCVCLDKQRCISCMFLPGNEPAEDFCFLCKNGYVAVDGRCKKESR